MSGGAAEFFEELRREYLAEAPARLAELRKDLAALHAGEPDAAASLKVRLHRLAGSGGSYGFPEISTASRGTEQWIIANPSPDAAGFAFLDESIGRIAHAFDLAAGAVGLPVAAAVPTAFGWRALVLGDEPDLSERVRSALADAQYTVERRPLDTDPGAIPVSERPDVAAIVATTRDQLATGLARWARPGAQRPGVVFLVAPPDLGDPLLEPASLVDLVIAAERIETDLVAAARARGRSATAPRSVLIVDSEEQGPVRTLTTALDGLAVKVRQVLGGLAARDELVREPPDLIVIEWRLPDTSAAALIRWIRQQPAHRLTPILVVAATVDEGIRLDALRAGADDAIGKATSGPHLAQVILARIERSRAIQASAHRDDLTGLLNGAAMVEEVERTVGYARRVGEPFAVLMIDPDHLRRINERYGQAVGDAALVHVARLITGSVRASDSVARTGGEEFTVLARRCPAGDAARIAEKLRGSIQASPLVHGADSVPLRVSIGVGCYPDHGNSAPEILGSAEKALGQAKGTGRDRVVIS